MPNNACPAKIWKCDIDYNFGHARQDEIIEKGRSRYLSRYLHEAISNFQCRKKIESKKLEREYVLKNLTKKKSLCNKITKL